MSASATAITHWGGVPIFVDIEPRTYTLDLQKLAASITNRTVGIIIVDIFGNPSNYKELRELAKNRGLWTLGDCAQAPGATVGDKHVASLSDIGGYSLNRHKHIQTGEGGFALTDNYDLATKMRLMRNHAEQVTVDEEYGGYYKIAGHNFRLGELEAAMALPQLHKLSDRVRTRRRAAQILASSLSAIPSFVVPSSDDFGKSAYYLFPLVFSDMSAERRTRFVEALKKAGIPGLVVRYQNIHRLPYFASREGVTNDKLPVSEKLYDSTFVGIQLCSASFGRVQARLVARAIHKAVMAST
jgi:dTDP-4-amino-4,6-dideoxygalactose transaminase